MGLDELEEKLNNLLNSWLIQNGFSCRVNGLSEDFCWYPVSDTIDYTFFYIEEAEKIWSRLLNELGLNFTINTFFTSFLHEVFHSETYHLLSEEEVEWSRQIKDQMEEDESSFDNIYEVYYRLPDEIEATAAMVKYINANVETVRELVNTVSPIIEKFYRDNGIAAA